MAMPRSTTSGRSRGRGKKAVMLKVSEARPTKRKSHGIGPLTVVILV
jgi:hypothetical protein